MIPFVERLEAALAAVVPPLAVRIDGSWSTRTRQVPAPDAALAGEEVLDSTWAGSVACDAPLAGIGFVHDGSSLFWVKSPPPSASCRIELSLHTYTRMPELGATFSAGFEHARLPGVRVRCGGDPVRCCKLGGTNATTGRAHLVAKVDGIPFVVLFLQAELLRTGRKRIWRLREGASPALPEDVQTLLTRRRSGALNTALPPRP